MKQNYTNDDEYKEILRKFMAIAFVELPDLQDAFEMLALKLLAYDHNDNHENFIQYFENTWVGRPRRHARFDPTMWNARTVTEIDLPRTTNNVESWHLAFQKSLSCHHPTIYKLAEQLIKENVRVNAIAIKLFNGEEVPLYSNPHYRDANVRLLNLIGR